MPVTKSSLEAYKDVQPKICSSQKRILKVVYNEKEPFCQKRILELVRLNYSRHYEINQITPRVNELVSLGIFLDVGRKNSRFSNTAVNHYIVNKNLFNNN